MTDQIINTDVITDSNSNLIRYDVHFQIDLPPGSTATNPFLVSIPVAALQTPTNLQEVKLKACDMASVVKKGYMVNSTSIADLNGPITI